MCVCINSTTTTNSSCFVCWSDAPPDIRHFLYLIIGIKWSNILFLFGSLLVWKWVLLSSLFGLSKLLPIDQALCKYIMTLNRPDILCTICRFKFCDNNINNFFKFIFIIKQKLLYFHCCGEGGTVDVSSVVTSIPLSRGASNTSRE